ncbi:MAG: hypothetical protein MUC50_17095 [Myxococcota bacterium]|jgi:hypothetical protein|nr:hypothetical protein [Myxococcota bacterium]
MSADLRQPAWVERTTASVDGTATTRLVFIFRAIGCAWARRPERGCTNCGFLSLTTRGAPVPFEDLIAQFESVFADSDAIAGIGEIDIFNSGSFFSEEEIPAAVREHVFDRLGTTAALRVLVESRPEHLREDRVRDAVARVGANRLEIGIGLESSDDRVREALVHKGFSREEFERAVAVLGATGARLLAYVLLKPLGLTEQQAVDDAVASSRYVFEVARRSGVAARVALQPTFVAPGSVLEEHFRRSAYTPPSLWSVLDAARRIHAMGELSIGASDEGLEPARAPAGCPRCTEKLRAAIRDYNQTRDLSRLELACACRG